MANTITEKLQALNNADLSKVSGRLANLKADIDAALKQQAATKAKSEKPPAANPPASNGSLDDFLNGLHQAKNRT